MTGMPGKSWSAPVPPLSAEEQLIHDKLRRHVEALAERIGERNVWHPEALAAAARYIRDKLEDSGYEVRAQSFESQGLTLQNLEVELPGDTAPREIIVLGAHYDSVLGTPGANDNASGVAALLEIARLLAGNSYPRTVRLVAFANEEPPFFYGEEMGSRVYASRARQRGEQIKAMLALETIGYYSDQPASQRYPFPFRFFYPDTGNFIGFVGNLSSRRLVRRALGAFRASTAFPSQGVTAPGWMTGVHWSDHWSFWQEGYPAIMVTDTALFRYRHYHAATDTPEKLDYPSLARVTRGLAEVAAELAGK
jgi:Zn-dependent M28 family amino/carboxypeptidase